jgi:uncharacterized protein involved in exopolysaccharide biosynthesis
MNISKREIGTICYLIGGVMPLLMLIHLFKAERIYEATARIQIDRDQGNLLRFQGEPASNGADDEVYLLTQYKNLLSRTLVHSVIYQLKLDQDPRYARKLDIVRAVTDDIAVTPVSLSRLVDIRVRHPDPRMATNIADTLTATFRNGILDSRTKAACAVVDRLQAEARDEAAKFAEAEKHLVDYSQNARQLFPFNQDQSQIVQALNQARMSYAAAQLRTRRARDVLAAADRHTAAGKPLTTFPGMAADRRLEQLALQLV